MAESVIHWFRRDLRLADNRALEGALRTGVVVIPVFILDRRILGQSTMGERRLQFLRTALHDLDARLRERGSRLLVLESDDPPRELNRLADETGSWALYLNRDYTPYARWRDTRATRGMQMTGVVTMPLDDLLLVSPLQTIGADQHLPTTFKAFSRRWFAALDLEPAPPPAEGLFMPADLLPAPVAGWEDLLAPGRPGPSDWPGATAESAEARLRDFVDHRLGGYPEGREFPSEDRTSRLSAALKFGTISTRRVAAAVVAHAARNPQAQASAERFITALAWREFAHHLLFNRPELLRQPLRTSAWEAEGAAEVQPPAGAGLEAWINARTGIPLVDAGIRQLHDQGWVNNRVRMVLASFLAYQLGADWRLGERHFARHLVDHDVACNDLGWQWSVGVGVDAAPYRRTFNPRHEGERFDPAGHYVRRFLPELRRVPDRYVHHPWDMPPSVQAAAGCRIPIDYASPVVPVARKRTG
jgi:deoxyribodipyrimidine photo-lyase